MACARVFLGKTLLLGFVLHGKENRAVGEARALQFPRGLFSSLAIAKKA